MTQAELDSQIAEIEREITARMDHIQGLCDEEIKRLGAYYGERTVQIKRGEGSLLDPVWQPREWWLK